MTENLYTLAYCSRNRIRGNETNISAELEQILAAARTNNARLGITGALLYSAGSFAQVLEGPLDSVAKVFEKIQRDLRHSEVIVVHNGPLGARQFPQWSMAFAGAEQNSSLATEAFGSVFAGDVGAGDQMLKLLTAMIQEEAQWILP